MWIKLNELTFRFCNGCVNDQPGQMAHDLCLLASDEERFNRLFDSSWEEINKSSFMEVIKLIVRMKMEKILNIQQSMGKILSFS